MTRVLLVGPETGGGEHAYMQSLAPRGVEYVRTARFHESVAGARCMLPVEIALNRFVKPFVVPDMGIRALTVDDAAFELVHVHGNPIVLRTQRPVIMSEGSSPIVYARDYLGWEESVLRRRVARTRALYRAARIRDRVLALDSVDHVYVFSDWARRLNIEWGADATKMSVLPPGFAIPSRLASPGSTDQFTYLFAGGDFERKGGFETVVAFDRIASRNARVHLVVLSPDPESRNPDRHRHSWVPAETREQGIELFRKLVRAGRLTWRPVLPRERLYDDVYPSVDAFVSPAHAEGFGFTNIEAMSFALPVVTSSVGPVSEHVDQTTGLLVKAGDVEALSAAMWRLAADPPLAVELGLNGRARFENRFTADRFATSLRDLYDCVLAQ